MKNFLLLIVLSIVSAGVAISQKESPVTWNFELKKTSNTDYEIVATATMKKSWVLYSQFTDDGGPIPTLFMIDDREIKMTEKSKVIKEFDSMFDVNVLKFKDTAVFTSKVQKGTSDKLTGFVEFMTCDGTKCLPPTEVKFDLKF
ncbi:MAG: hypothetical protein WAU01_08355 [Saprospiraceae bacterium]